MTPTKLAFVLSVLAAACSVLASVPRPADRRQLPDAQCTQAVFSLAAKQPVPPSDILSTILAGTDICDFVNIPATMTSEYSSYTSVLAYWWTISSAVCLSSLSPCPPSITSSLLHNVRCLTPVANAVSPGAVVATDAPAATSTTTSANPLGFLTSTTSYSAYSGPTPDPQCAEYDDQGRLDGNGCSSGLSQGAKIGIGVGVTLGVIALAAVAYLLWRHRRKRKQASVPVQPAPEEASKPVKQLSGPRELASKAVDVQTRSVSATSPSPALPIDAEAKPATSTSPQPYQHPVAEIDPNPPTQLHEAPYNPHAAEIDAGPRRQLHEMPYTPQAIEIDPNPPTQLYEMPYNPHHASEMAAGHPSQVHEISATPQPAPVFPSLSYPSHSYELPVDPTPAPYPYGTSPSPAPGAASPMMPDNASVMSHSTLVNPAPSSVAGSVHSGYGAASGGGGDAQEAEALRARHAQLEARRRTLLELRQIEEEQQAIQDRLSRTGP